MAGARKLTGEESASKTVTFGVVGTGDPRMDAASRQRAANIVQIVADRVAASVRMPNGAAVEVVWTPLLVDGEKQADMVGRMFRQSGVDAVICTPDTWAFPQLTLMSLLAHLSADTPVNITCGDSGPKPGVVFAHAVGSAPSPSSGRLTASTSALRPTPASIRNDRGHHEGARGLVRTPCATTQATERPPRGRLGPRFDGDGDRPCPRHPDAANRSGLR